MNHTVKRQLTQILEVCIQKQIHYSLNPQVFNVSVYTPNRSFSGNAYYHGQLYNAKAVCNGELYTLSDLLKKVKQL